MAAIAAGTSIASAISRGVQARKQGQMAEDIREQYPRPTYEIPQSQQEALEISRGLSTMGLPGLSATQGMMGEATSAGVRALRESGQDPASILAAVTGLYSQQQKQATQLGITDAQQRLANLAGLQGQLGVMAGYEDKAFDMNQWQPYMQAAQAAGALEQASITNKQQAFDQGVSTFSALSSAIGGLTDFQSLMNSEASGGGGNPLDGFNKMMGGGNADPYTQMASQYQEDISYNPYKGLPMQQSSGYRLPMQQGGGFSF